MIPIYVAISLYEPTPEETELAKYFKEHPEVYEKHRVKPGMLTPEQERNLELRIAAQEMWLYINREETPEKVKAAFDVFCSRLDIQFTLLRDSPFSKL